MPTPAPPQIEESLAQLRAAVQQVDKKDFDPVATPWAEIEKSIVKLLGGVFDLGQPQHQVVALGLSGVLGEKLGSELKGFWFPQRDALEGAAIGFPDALIMLSPFGAVTDALANANLSKLDEVIKEIRGALAKVKFSMQGGPANQTLSPVDYQRLFDPGFIQLVTANGSKVTQAFNMTPEQLSREIRDALTRGGAQLPPEVRQQLESQLVGSLQRLEPGKPLSTQVPRAPRVAELVGHLFATQAGTGSAPEEFWTDIALPLLFIGNPESFPPVEKDEQEAIEQGAEPLLLFLDVVPYQTPAPEEGLLGAFPVEKVSVPHPAFAEVPTLRMFKVDPAAVQPQLDTFDVEKTRQSLQRFIAHLKDKTGKDVQPTPQGAQLFDAALQLLADLKAALKGPAKDAELWVRRLTEAEAASESALRVIRTALQGPRLIMPGM